MSGLPPKTGKLAGAALRRSARRRALVAAPAALVALALSAPWASGASDASQRAASAAASCPQPTPPATSKPAARPVPAKGTTTSTATTTNATTTATPFAPSVSYPTPTVAVTGTSVAVKALVSADGKPGSAFVRFGVSGFLRCSDRVNLSTGSSTVRVSVPLGGLIPRATYRYEVGTSAAGVVAYGPPGTFVAPGPPRIAAGVSLGPIALGGATRARALELMTRFLSGRLRFTFEDVYWSAPRAELGAGIDTASALDRAFAAPAGTHLQLQLTLDAHRLDTYLAQVGRRFGHAAQKASIRLVGTRAVVQPARSAVAVDLPLMASAVRSALRSGLSERLRLIVSPSLEGDVTTTKAVVVRLQSQTLTAYLNGKPILRTPVTTGRPALPTPVGSYHVIFRASPFVFNSPWPPGSPYWYPPTPVTWAMDFFGGDFLHDDPGEPSDAFGAGSEDGPYASHGCVHVPHDVMAFLYNWLPVGAQVVVADD